MDVRDREIILERPGPHRERVVVRRRMDHDGPHHAGPGPMIEHRGPHHGAPAGHFRIERGHRVPGYWMHPRFHIQDFGRYGFYQPMWGGRWIRYYDDALLVDPYGQVIDGQWGMKWDEYDHDWRRGDDGIPEYVGDGDYYPDDEDYAWAEGRDGYAGHHGYGQGGYGYHYPQGAGAIVITETITTTAPTVTEKVWYEDVHQKRPAKKRKPRLKGERG
jgi:Ni/Co efflux regulator RcnB